MDACVGFVFGFVYLGMMLGGFRGLALDRTGVALLGAIALLASGRVTPDEAWRAVDVPTISLLFGLMVLSAQFRLGGFYAALTRKLTTRGTSPALFLGEVIAAAGLLSALLANDIVCLAMAPILVEVCAQRRLRPLPFLVGLACASNVGSAATLIGNPQNMLVGQVLGLSFNLYLLQAGPPAVLGLGATWALLCALQRGRWTESRPIPVVEAPPFNRWQTTKGLIVLGALVAAFLATSWPRDVVALAAAGVLLLSRRVASRTFLSLVDWQLLVLFIGLFVVNHGLEATGGLTSAIEAARGLGIDPASPGWLFAATAILSNLVSNVPATMLLLPTVSHPLSGPILCLASTLAGNLIIVGSIANIIVVDQAARCGLTIGWRDHFRLGAPVTLATLALAALWLWWIA